MEISNLTVVPLFICFAWVFRGIAITGFVYHDIPTMVVGILGVCYGVAAASISFYVWLRQTHRNKTFSRLTKIEPAE